MSEGKSDTVLHITQFNKALHDRSAFSCGFTPIDRFLKTALSDHIKSGYLTAFVATQEGGKEVLGFYTLNAFAICPEHVETPKRPTPPPTIPATYIKAVAVDQNWQGQGIGNALMIHALRKSLLYSDQIGSMAIVLDVLADDHVDRRRAFYAALGFKQMNDPNNANRMYLSMADVRTTLG